MEVVCGVEGFIAARCGVEPLEKPLEFTRHTIRAGMVDRDRRILCAEGLAQGEKMGECFHPG